MKKVLISFAIVIAYIFTTNAFATTSYSIIVDAGSTGSRLHLFAYDASKQNSVPLIAEIFTESNKPGISSFAKNPEKAGASYKKLLDDTMTFMKSVNINPQDVSVNILATAGMRLLPEQEQQAIYNSIVSYIKNNYSVQFITAETISGKMEAVYGWLNVNYLADNFTAGKTIGTIDIGGASTEIAFATANTKNSDDKVNLKINGKHYIVYSKSFLGLGQDVVRDEMNKDLLAKSCYPTNYPLASTVQGDFNFNACQEIYKTIIRSFSIDIPATANHQFIAFSGAYYDYQFIGADKTPDQGIVEGNIQKICKTTWEQLQKDHPNDAAKYLSTYCANATYVTTLINGAYGLQDGQLTVANRINSRDIDWTLGALMYELVR